MTSSSGGKVVGQAQGPGRKAVLAGLFFAAVGLAVSAYLASAGGASPAATSASSGGATAGGGGGSVLFCGPGSGCETVWSSPYSRLLGLGLPGWGVLVYAALVAGGLLWTLGFGPGGWPVRGAAVALSWAVAGFSAYLIWLQAAVLKAFCPWCLVTDLCGLLAAAAYTVAASREGRRDVPGREGRPEAVRRLRPGGRAAGPPGGSRGTASQQPGRVRPVATPALLGVAGAAVVGVTHWWVAGAALPAVPPVRPTTGVSVTALPGRLEQLEALVSAGPSGAPARVDVYADFQCPYCARAAREVIAPLMAQDVAEGRMRIVFHNFAFLGAESRWAAEAAVCAAAQGRFWPFHDRLFAAQRGENVGTFRPERLVAMARDEGLGVEAFQRCLEQRSARSLVEASYEEGRRRGVRATPTFIVNGRLVEGLVPVEVIRQLAYGGGQ